MAGFVAGIAELGIGIQFAKEAFPVATSALSWIVIIVLLLVARSRYGQENGD